MDLHSKVVGKNKKQTVDIELRISIGIYNFQREGDRNVEIISPPPQKKFTFWGNVHRKGNARKLSFYTFKESELYTVGFEMEMSLKRLGNGTWRIY